MFLYKKVHNITGLKYLGVTSKDPFKYKGSGSIWLSHINQYGNNVKTEILLKTDSCQELRDKGIYYSNLWNIVNSNEWANVVVESGNGGTMKSYNQNTNKDMITMTEAAMLVGKNKSTIYRAIKNGKLNHININEIIYIMRNDLFKIYPKKENILFNNATWMTYAEIANKFNMSSEAARQMSIRNDFTRKIGENGKTIVEIPNDFEYESRKRNKIKINDDNDSIVVKVYENYIESLKNIIEDLKEQLNFNKSIVDKLLDTK